MSCDCTHSKKVNEKYFPHQPPCYVNHKDEDEVATQQAKTWLKVESVITVVGLGAMNAVVSNFVYNEVQSMPNTPESKFVSAMLITGSCLLFAASSLATVIFYNEHFS